MSSTDFEKTPFKSKKFIAYLLAEVGWKIILAVMIVIFGDGLELFEWALMLSVVLVSGFVQVGMILGQGSLDKFIRLAKINASLGVPTHSKGMHGPSAGDDEGEESTDDDTEEP